MTQHDQPRHQGCCSRLPHAPDDLNLSKRLTSLFRVYLNISLLHKLQDCTCKESCTQDQRQGGLHFALHRRHRQQRGSKSMSSNQMRFAQSVWTIDCCHKSVFDRNTLLHLSWDAERHRRTRRARQSVLYKSNSLKQPRSLHNGLFL